MRVVAILLLTLGLLVQTETATVEGIVIKQGSSDPIQGAVVTFTPQAGTPKTGTSGEDGKFVIANLPPGRYQVTSTRTGFVKGHRTSGPSNLTLTAGQRLADVRIQLTPTAVVTGRVLDENGVPKARTSVIALRPEYQNGRRVLWTCYSQQPNARAQTNTEGEYRLFGLEPGEYYIVADLEGSGCGNTYYPGAMDPADAIPVTLRAGTETGGIEIRGKSVKRYAVRFNVTLPPALIARGPVSRVQVVRVSRNALAVSEFLPTGSGMVDGVYTAPGLLPGSYELYFDNGLGVQVGLLKFEIFDRDVDAGTMIVKPGIALAGRLLAPEGVPSGWAFDRVRVLLRPLDLRDRGMAGALNTLSTAAADGTFLKAFAANTGSTERPGTIAEGRYQLYLTGLIEDQYLASARIGAVDVLDTGLIVDGPLPGPMEITILNGGRVEGMVRNAKDEPVADSRVVIVPAQNRRGNLNLFKTDMTDQYGRFSIRGVAPGDYGVLAWEDIDNGAWESAEFLKDFESRAVRVSVVAGSANNASVRVIPVP